MPEPTVIVWMKENEAGHIFWGMHIYVCVLHVLRCFLPFALMLTVNHEVMNMTQHQSLLSPFGSPFERVEKALHAVRQGQGVLVVDDELRENEGDIIFAAEHCNTSHMALLIRECSGIVCLCLPDEKADALDLPPMVRNNTNTQGTAFTVSIEAAAGVSTGVSAADRVTTIQAAIADDAAPQHLHRPGHVFPLRARQGGVLERRGHTEATVDIMRLAGLKPFGVLCELTNADGSMARLPEVTAFARQHQMPVMSVDDLVQYRKAHPAREEGKARSH